MVTCSIDHIENMTRRHGSSVSSGFRLLDGDQLDTQSSLSRNSIYKLKIDSMFDDTRSIMSQHVEDRIDRKCSMRSGSTRSSSIIQRNRLTDLNKLLPSSSTTNVNDDVERVSNNVQAQIERMFTDVAKDATSCSFPVKCLGFLPLQNKVTSLQGLQYPLRELYINGTEFETNNTGNLDICSTGIRVRTSNGRETQMTSFHNIAVWSAVKFIISATDGGAAFLPLITDPENIDKSSLFQPLSTLDKRRLSSGAHAPVFAVVMRSLSTPRSLECHAFVCKTSEDAIVIAATLYQCLMTHMGNSQNQKPRKPRNQNGVSCISIASSSIGNNLFEKNKLQLRQFEDNSGSNNGCSPSLRTKLQQSTTAVVGPPRPPRKKRSASNSLSGESDIVRDHHQPLSTNERKKKSHKTRKAPPIPSLLHKGNSYNSSLSSYLEKSQRQTNIPTSDSHQYQGKDLLTGGGDIFTRVAIPRSGSFLNTSGLTKYKSRATRRAAGKNGGGGGGGRSPLGFSELFNEFRLQENLHSLDDILNAIINSDGMSFNDLKPIYKEFLLKLAVTLTKDELYQRSKNIMRQQKKRKLRRKNSHVQKERKGKILGSKGFKKIFWFGKFRTNKLKKLKQQQQHQKFDIKAASTRQKSKENEIRTGTSSSDVSDPRNELHTLNRHNRNSSSGYVSCSECSYDSEACTCTSADRCYCSLGADHDQINTKLNKTSNRDSLFSCQTEDKCYCSVSERNENGANSETTTWCDTDSCISSSKCYCKSKRNIALATSAAGVMQKKKHGCQTSDNFALDYELFTIGGHNKAGCGGGGGGGKHVKAHEALSVKKSVEMAAIFADVKLSQTTDIKSMMNNQSKNSSISSKNRRNLEKHNNLAFIDAATFKCPAIMMEQKNRKHHDFCNEDPYQPISHAVSATLENSLGYLP